MAAFGPHAALLGALAAAGIAAVAALVARRVANARRRAARGRMVASRGPGRPRGSRNKPLPSRDKGLDDEWLRYLRRLRRTDPAAYRVVMGEYAKQRLGPEGEMTMAEVHRVLAALRPLGLVVVPVSAGSVAVQVAEKLAPQLPALITAYLGNAPVRDGLGRWPVPPAAPPTGGGE